LLTGAVCAAPNDRVPLPDMDMPLLPPGPAELLCE
jgi:hypothetical protein